jgi:hypothetical protein
MLIVVHGRPKGRREFRRVLVILKGPLQSDSRFTDVRDNYIVGYVKPLKHGIFRRTLHSAHASVYTFPIILTINSYCFPKQN